MPDVVFTCPVDGTNREVDAEEVVHLLRTRGEDYWNDPDGSGFARLSYFPEGNGNEPGLTASLDITRLDRLGFHVFYRYEVAELDSPYYREPEFSYTYRGGELGSRSRVNWAGEEQQIYDALFVDLPDAVAAVREFIATGGRAPDVAWIDANEVRQAERAH